MSQTDEQPDEQPDGQPDGGDIESTGHERWVPIPLEGDPDAMADDLVARFGDEHADDAAAMAGVSRRLVEANATADETHTMNLAAWALVAQRDALDVRGFATLQVAVLDDAEVAAADVVVQLAGAETLFEDPVSQPMDTMSGDALSVRLRPMVDEDGASRVHELAAVLWSRPQFQAWYVLSTYTMDLVEAAEVGDLLDELGAGIKGL